jgi:signal transduction histidine kinase
MTASTRSAVWTGLLAGAVAHDINNFVQGVSSARSLARAFGAAPGRTTADAAETEAIIEEDLDQLRKMGSRLRALAGAGSQASTRLADACADACAEVDRTPEQLQAESIPPELCVVGTAAAVRTAIASLLEHALAASPAAAPIRLTVDATGHAPGSPVIVEISAPEFGELGPIGRARLDVALAGSLPELRGDARLILAGAIADAIGGAVYIASDSKAGLVLTLHLVAGAPPLR